MSVRLQFSSVASETGPLLEQYLKDRGVLSRNAEAVVCYGDPDRGNPKAINGNCARGKLFNMEAMTRAGVRLVPWFKGLTVPANIKFPLLARKNHGHGGEDIVPVFQKKEVEWRVKSGWNWFSSHIPTDTEYRVWVFRGEILDTYEKKMMRPDSYKWIGRNFRNGFDFVHVANHNDASREAKRALEALEYDFGAVDLLRSEEDGQVYVLEVNSAPGVIKSGAQKTLAKFADAIVAWDRAGHPSR